MFLGINHIEIVVRDIEHTIRWYQSMGCILKKRTKHHGGSAEFVFPGSEFPIIELHQASGEEVIGVNHIAFSVSSVREEVSKLKKVGISFENELIINKNTHRELANFRDPDGWRVQIVSCGDKIE